MTREEEILIEKVIWLIEDSYPDTNDWGHDTLINRIKEDLVARADELNRMWLDDAHPINPWHKVSEELPKVDKYRKCIKVFARRGDDVFVAFYSPVVGFSLSSSFYTEHILSNIEYWMPIPELPKED